MGAIMRRRDRRDRRGAAVGLTLAALLLAGLPAAGAATPAYPDPGQVRRAQRRTAAAADDVRGIQQRLDWATARVEAADVALSTAAEDFDQAQVELDRAQRAAAGAADVSRRASARLDAAQQQVGRLAAQSYRSGGPVASLEVLLSPSGPDVVLERASMLRTVAAHRQQDVQRMDAARVVATSLRTQADQALARQEAAARRLDRARAAAADRARRAHDVLTAENRTRADLLRRLAAARRTSVALERARQAGLVAERQAAQRRAVARQAAARRAATRLSAADHSSSGSSSSGPRSSGPAGPEGSAGPSGSAGSSGPDPTGGSSGSASAGASALAWARHQIGLPYRWGGDGPGSYDCSGLVMRAWQQAGVLLPHSSRLQYRQVEKISYSRLRPGDLLFFATDPADPDTIHHVALYAGGGRMLEAPYTGADVRLAPLRRSDAMPYAGRP
jgi:peptidoglycan DL-endopeptidase CwlO